MKNNLIKKYIICAVIPLLILFLMGLQPLAAIFYGDEIQLKTKPFDPRDIFRGDHVQLDYEISEIAMSSAPEIFKDGDNYSKLRNTKLYVVLKKDGDYYIVDYATLEKPVDKLYLNAQYSYTSYDYGNSITEKEMQEKKQVGKSIVVLYNLDKYFVPENTGKDLEELSRKGQLSAKVKVWKGYSYLIDVF
jgi:uncharacterized membrane-anchored protein